MSGLFRWRGRLGRTGYLLTCLGLVLAVGIILVIGIGFIMTQYFPGVIAAWGLAALLGAWTGTAAAARRLRDMGRNPAHALWLPALASALVYADDHFPPAALALALAMMGMGLWLVLTPGRPESPISPPPA